LRYDPRLRDDAKRALVLDSKPPKVRVEDFAYNEMRFRLLVASDPVRARMLMDGAQREAERRYEMFRTLASATP
jgi:pyruvate-ferredoxin/flavodoxin oxidoreductase